MKKTFKKIFGLVLSLAVIVGCVCGFAACGNDPDNKPTVTMYTEAGFAPYEWLDLTTKKVTGLDVAIMSQVAENLGAKLDVQNVYFDTITQLTKNGSGYVVGAAGITINEKRKQAVDFSNVYANSQLVIVSKDGSLDSIKSLEGKKVAVQTSTSGHTVCKTNGNIEIKTYNTYAEMKKFLLQGNVFDAIVMDKLPAEALANGTTLVIKDATDVPADDFGIMFKKGMDQKFVDEINNVINTWKENGNMAKYSLYYTQLYTYEQAEDKSTVEEPQANGLKLTWNC